MVVKTLVENTSIDEGLAAEHGLSLYIETKKHRILFDLGSSDLFFKNAKVLGVDIAKVDVLIISHGHYDHGGGLATFLQENSIAKIYVQERAFGKYYSKLPNGALVPIGLPEEFKDNERIVWVAEKLIIDDELSLFSKVEGRELFSKSNESLLKGEGDKVIPDDFRHEQNLIIDEDDQTLLIAGCAHNGIVNIVKRYLELRDKAPDYIIGGFHLTNPSYGTNEDFATIKGIASYLNSTKSKYYTCHCTGLEPYKKLKELMDDKIDYIATGSVLEF